MVSCPLTTSHCLWPSSKTLQQSPTTVHHWLGFNCASYSPISSDENHITGVDNAMAERCGLDLVSTHTKQHPLPTPKPLPLLLTTSSFDATTLP
jgi:hypothetical protein